jgi:hypothetical protein
LVVMRLLKGLDATLADLLAAYEQADDHLRA